MFNPGKLTFSKTWHIDNKHALTVNYYNNFGEILSRMEIMLTNPSEKLIQNCGCYVFTVNKNPGSKEKVLYLDYDYQPAVKAVKHVVAAIDAAYPLDDACKQDIHRLIDMLSSQNIKLINQRGMISMFKPIPTHVDDPYDIVNTLPGIRKLCGY